MIRYSPKFIQKAGGIDALAKYQKQNLLASIVFYCIDSEFRTVVNASRWFKEQMLEFHANYKYSPMFLKWKELPQDQAALEILKYVYKNFDYVTDDQQFKTPEKWQDPIQTMMNQKGDCEDMSILIVTLMRFVGIPAERVVLCCGWVEDPRNKKAKVGHCWVQYVAECDGAERILDACYWPNMLPIEKRLLAGEEKKYKEVWFSFNDSRHYGKYQSK